MIKAIKPFIIRVELKPKVGYWEESVQTLGKTMKVLKMEYDGIIM